MGILEEICGGGVGVLGMVVGVVGAGGGVEGGLGSPHAVVGRLDILHAVVTWQKNFKRIVSLGGGYRVGKGCGG